MNIAEAVELIEKGQFVRHTDKKGISIFYFKLHILPFGSEEIGTIESDDMDYEEKRPESFKDIPWARRDSVSLNAILLKEFVVETKERVLAIVQESWDKSHQGKM